MLLEEFKQKLQHQIEYYKKIDELSVKEKELIAQKELNELRKILEEKQGIMNKIGKIEDEIKDEISNFEKEETIITIGKELTKIINEVLIKEKENQELLVAKLEEIKLEAGKMKQQQQVSKMYKKGEIPPRFIDKKK